MQLPLALPFARLSHLSILALALTACGEPVTPPPIGNDGGTDAQVDVDAFMPPVDAGSDAGPPPTPLQMEVMAVQEQLTALDMMNSALPMGDRLDAEHLTLDALVVRLDAIIGEKGLVASTAIIGEKGLEPVALPVNAVPTIVIVRQLSVAIADLDALVRAWAGSMDPATMAIHDALVAYRFDLVSLQQRLLTRFRMIVDGAAGVPGTLDTGYADVREFTLVGADPVVLHVIVEGDMSRQAFMGLDCGGASVDVTIIDEERVMGMPPLARTPTSGSFGTMFTARAMDTNVLHVELTPVGTGGFWPSCSSRVAGPRFFRGAQIDQMVDMLGFSAADDLQGGAIGAIESLLAGERSGSPPPEDERIFAAIERLVAELAAENGTWRAFPVVLYEDDIEVMELTIGEVLLPVAAAMRTSPALSDSRWDGYTFHIGEIETSSTQALTLLR